MQDFAYFPFHFYFYSSQPSEMNLEKIRETTSIKFGLKLPIMVVNIMQIC